MPIPLRGDRAVHDSLNYPELHANDLEDGTPIQHNPSDAEEGEAPVWDGSKWVATDIATQAELNYHEGESNPHGTTFIDLTDAPGSYSDVAGFFVRVNAEEDGLEFAEVETTIPALDDLTDVNIVNGATGDIIYNNADIWENYPLGIGTKITANINKLRFGNTSGGNYIDIDATTGDLRLHGNATSWDDLRISGSSARVGVTAPSLDTFGPSGSLRVLRFEEGHHDEIYFEVQMPHSWKEGSKIYPHVHWSPVTTEAGNVVWQFDYTWANINEAFGAPTTMTSDATAAGGTAWVHKITTLKDGSSNAYIDGTGKTLSSMLICRLHRDAGSGSDTLSEDVAFLEFDLHYEIDSFGSDEEYIKDADAALLLESGDYFLLESGDTLLLE